MASHWLWFTLPVTAISLIVLPIFIWRLIDIHQSQFVLSVPLRADQEIDIATAGAYVLNAEGPRFSRAFGGLGFRLKDLTDQTEVPLAPTLIPFSSSGMTRSRLSLYGFELEKPGRLQLTVTGITDPSVAEENDLVVTRDRRGGIFSTVLVMVFSAVGLIAGSVLSALIFLMKP